MTQNRMRLIALYLQTYVSKYFAIYLNKKIQGNNFKWADFPEMAHSYCLTNMWPATGLARTSRNKTEDIDYISRESVSIAKELIKLAGLKDEE